MILVHRHANGCLVDMQLISLCFLWKQPVLHLLSGFLLVFLVSFIFCVLWMLFQIGFNILLAPSLINGLNKISDNMFILPSHENYSFTFKKCFNKGNIIKKRERQKCFLQMELLSKQVYSLDVNTGPEPLKSQVNGNGYIHQSTSKNIPLEKQTEGFKV